MGRISACTSLVVGALCTAVAYLHEGVQFIRLCASRCLTSPLHCCWVWDTSLRVSQGEVKQDTPVRQGPKLSPGKDRKKCTRHCAIDWCVQHTNMAEALGGGDM
jgi:hypothetical protein